MPRLRFLPSQENGARIKVTENGANSIFPLEFMDKDCFLHTCEAPGTGPGPENTESLCPATVLR